MNEEYIITVIISRFLRALQDTWLTYVQTKRRRGLCFDTAKKAFLLYKDGRRTATFSYLDLDIRRFLRVQLVSFPFLVFLPCSLLLYRFLSFSLRFLSVSCSFPFQLESIETTIRHGLAITVLLHFPGLWQCGINTWCDTTAGQVSCCIISLCVSRSEDHKKKKKMNWI